jgi:hypothetical protein
MQLEEVRLALGSCWLSSGLSPSLPGDRGLRTVPKAQLAGSTIVLSKLVGRVAAAVQLRWSGRSQLAWTRRCGGTQ